jgi:hypothetical protein
MEWICTEQALLLLMDNIISHSQCTLLRAYGACCGVTPCEHTWERALSSIGQNITNHSCQPPAITYPLDFPIRETKNKNINVFNEK